MPSSRGSPWRSSRAERRKSTLLNRLLNEERALVSDIAGTTRDVIEERTNIDGVEFRFLDTAGIRTTEDRLERMGIERTLSSIARAQIIIRLLDASQAGDTIPAPDFEVRRDQRLLTVMNKLDCCPDRILPEGVLGLSAKPARGSTPCAARCALRSTRRHSTTATPSSLTAAMPRR